MPTGAGCHVIYFKYLGPEGVGNVLANDSEVELRFALPTAYNDLCELFLQPYAPLEEGESAIRGSVHVWKALGPVRVNIWLVPWYWEPRAPITVMPSLWRGIA